MRFGSFNYFSYLCTIKTKTYIIMMNPLVFFGVCMFLGFIPKLIAVFMTNGEK